MTWATFFVLIALAGGAVSSCAGEVLYLVTKPEPARQEQPK